MCCEVTNSPPLERAKNIKDYIGPRDPKIKEFENEIIGQSKIQLRDYFSEFFISVAMGCGDEKIDDPSMEHMTPPPSIWSIDSMSSSQESSVGGETDAPVSSPDISESQIMKTINVAPDSEPDDTRPDVQTETCGLDGLVAVKIVAEVTWPESLALEGGQGAFEIWFRAQLTDEGTGLKASGQVCSVDVPDFHTKAIAGGDTHGTVIPSAAWTCAGRTDLVIDLESREIGSAFQMNATALFLGSESMDPMGSWPESGRRLNSVDHDGDGYPGVTSLAVAGPGYSNPRIPIINPDLRADRIFLGLRNMIGFYGMITRCDRADGRAYLSFDQRAFGCLTPERRECNRAQTDLLDSHMPQFEVSSAAFTLQAINPDTNCTDMVDMIP